MTKEEILKQVKDSHDIDVVSEEVALEAMEVYAKSQSVRLINKIREDSQRPFSYFKELQKKYGKEVLSAEDIVLEFQSKI